jgi:hypothetical protein
MTMIAEKRGPAYDVAQLSSLFTVCAVALDGADEYCDDVAEGIRQSVQHILEWGAVLASNICEDVEKLEIGETTEPVRMTGGQRNG